MVLLDVLAGWPGPVHDSRVLHNSSICLQANNRFPNDSLIRRWRISPCHVRSSSNFFTIYIHSLSYIHCFEFMHQWYLFHSRWLMTPFRDNGHLTANHSRFNSRFSSVRQTVERCNMLLKGRWRKLQFLDHLDMERMVLCTISVWLMVMMMGVMALGLLSVKGGAHVQYYWYYHIFVALWKLPLT